MVSRGDKQLQTCAFALNFVGICATFEEFAVTSTKGDAAILSHR